MAASQVRYGKEWASVCTANTFTQRITYCTRWQRWRLQYPRWRVIYVEKRKRGAVDIISSDWNGGNGRKNIRNWINSNPSRIAMGAGIWGKELWYVALETNKIAVNNLLLFFYSIFAPSLFIASRAKHNVQARQDAEKQWNKYLCKFSERLTLAVDELITMYSLPSVCRFKRKRKHMQSEMGVINGSYCGGSFMAIYEPMC